MPQLMAPARIAVMDFPTKLSRLCWEKDWTQRDLADRLEGVSKSTVSNWMTGKTDPRRKELMQLARLFGVPVAYLASDEMQEPAGDGLSEVQRRILWAAETVGYELALKRIMNVPGSAAEASAGPEARRRTPGREGGRGRRA